VKIKSSFPPRANQALEQTRDSVLRYGEVVGCELLNFFVRPQEDHSQEAQPRGAASVWGRPAQADRWLKVSVVLVRSASIFRLRASAVIYGRWLPAREGE
jgi:hypothetical protein